MRETIEDARLYKQILLFVSFLIFALFIAGVITGTFAIIDNNLKLVDVTGVLFGASALFTAPNFFILRDMLRVLKSTKVFD